MPLTGAGSRSRLDEDLAALCARVVRYGHAYCVAMVGLEPGTSDVLERAGRALVHEIRSGDAVYRSGAAEFVVLLPEQALDTANLAAARLRRAVEQRGAGRDRRQRRDRHHRRRRAGAGGAAGARGRGAEALERDRRRRGLGSADGGAALRLIVADDDPVSRLMLGAIVKREPGFELVGEAEDADPGDRARAAATARTSCCWTSTCPAAAGRGRRSRSAKALPEVRIVAISADDSQGTQYDMMRAGAVGFVIKGSSDDEILRVIRLSALVASRHRGSGAGRLAGASPRGMRYSTDANGGNRP